MQINQISQLLQPKVGQTISNNNSSDNKAFELLLQEMMQSSNSQATSNTPQLVLNNSINGINLINGLNGTDLTSSVNATDKTGVQNKAVSGLDSLSLNPQKMAQMLQIMQMSSSDSVMANFGSDDGSNSDTDSDTDSASSSDSFGTIGSMNPAGGNDDITQLLQSVLQNQATSSSNTNNSNSPNSQIQQLAVKPNL